MWETMRIAMFNGISFAIEFIKILLVVKYLFYIPVKKFVYKIFVLILLAVMTFTYLFDVNEFTDALGLLSIILILLGIDLKRKWKIVVLSYLGISLIDMLFAVLIFHFWELNLEQVYNGFGLRIMINSISILLIFIFILFFRKIKILDIPNITYTNFSIFLIGGVALSIYLTAVQFVELDAKARRHRYAGVISSVVLIIVFMIICYLLILKQKENEQLRIEDAMNRRLLDAHNNYYNIILKNEQETKAFRHDIKMHITSLHMLYEQKRFHELGEYLKQMEEKVHTTSTKHITGNSYVDAIMNDLSERYMRVLVHWDGKLPPMNITSIDLCTLFYNLLCNAFEAANNTSPPVVEVKVGIQNNNLVLTVSNHYVEIKSDKKGRFETTKNEKGHGYGLLNIQQCVKKYDGIYSVHAENHIFFTEIFLPEVLCK